MAVGKSLTFTDEEMDRINQARLIASARLRWGRGDDIEDDSDAFKYAYVDFLRDLVLRGVDELLGAGDSRVLQAFALLRGRIAELERERESVGQ